MKYNIIYQFDAGKNRISQYKWKVMGNECDIVLITLTRGHRQHHQRV